MVVLSPSKTKIMCPAADAVSAWASVSNGAVEVPALPAALLETYQTQPVMVIVTWPMSVRRYASLPQIPVYLVLEIGLLGHAAVQERARPEQDERDSDLTASPVSSL